MVIPHAHHLNGELYQLAPAKALALRVADCLLATERARQVNRLELLPQISIVIVLCHHSAPSLWQRFDHSQII